MSVQEPEQVAFRLCTHRPHSVHVQARKCEGAWIACVYLHVLLAHTCGAPRGYEQAIAAFGEALRLSPGDPALASKMGRRMRVLLGARCAHTRGQAGRW